jgi:hypothetical protein
MFAQDLSNIQIHGFVSQGFIYSTNNNLLTMNTSNGSAAWSDGAVSFNDSLSDKLRVGIQVHAFQLGSLGGPNVQVDWATGEYRASDKARFVVGKVKTVFGLYNDTQDIDAVHLWALLPQGVYPIDNKNFNLAHYGADFYGSMPLGTQGGSVTYRVYAGYRPLDVNGGYAEGLAPLIGSSFTSGGSDVLGGDLRWETPLKGLLVGASALTSGLTGTAPTGSFHVPYQTQPQLYAKFERGKFMVAGEHNRLTSEFYATINLPGGGSVTQPSTFDYRSWYVMTAYQATPKLHVGAYYSHFMDTTVTSPNPARATRDWVVSGRYDFTSHIYMKLEGHFIGGTATSYYGADNPNGLKPKTNMLAARMGFTF